MSPNERADRAKALLEDEVFRDALADVRMRLVAKLEGTDSADRDAEHEFALMLRVLKMIPVQLQNYVNESTMAKAKAREAEFAKSARGTLDGAGSISRRQ